MLRTVKYIICTFLATVLLTSCGDKVSLQRYFVDNQESANFITQDLPLSLVKIDESKFNEEQKEAYNSVKRLNFLGYKASEDNKAAYQAELTKVKSILSDEKYNELMTFSDKGSKIQIKYIGDDDEADEVIVFGSSNELGFAVVRVLGNNMNPDKMMTLAAALKDSEMGGAQMQDIMNFFK